MKTPIIIITGYPGTGKTTLGRQLAEKYSLPFISKDGIKEILFESLGWKDREWSMKLGSASYDLLFYLVREVLRLKKPIILETHFTPQSAKEFIELETEYEVLPLQIICTADPAVILDRVKNRVSSGERHPGHVDDTRFEELKERVDTEYQPLKIGGEKIMVDTTDFERLDYRPIYEFIENGLQRDNIR